MQWLPPVRALRNQDGEGQRPSKRREGRSGVIQSVASLSREGLGLVPVTEVMRRCGDPRRPHGWINDDFIRAYTTLHELGWAHSIETWRDGELVGGLYGVGIGRMFFGESMFMRRTDASKIALAALVCFCREHGVAKIDCQQRTGHLASLGGRELPRADFEQRLTRALGEPPIADWTYHPSLWRHLGIGVEGADAEQDTGP